MRKWFVDFHTPFFRLSVTAASAVVYDSIETSPYYDGSPNDMYIDERDLIELPAPHQQD